MQSNIGELREKILELPKEQRQELIRELKELMEMVEPSNKEFVYGSPCLVMRIIKAATKGAMTGAGIAGIVNTVAPGIIPTFCGYLVGKGFGDILIQGGLVTLGTFASPSVNSIAVLGVATAFGGTLGSMAGLVNEARRMRLRCFKE